MRRTTILLAAAIAASAVLAPPAAAQSREKQVTLRGLDDLKPGAQIRVTTLSAPPERLKGDFAGLRNDLLLMRVGAPQPRELRIGELLRVDEAYRDHKRGAIYGALPGLLIVYAWDFFGPHPKYADQGKRYTENAIALVAVSGGGALLGGTLGWKRWRLVHTAGR